MRHDPPRALIYVVNIPGFFTKRYDFWTSSEKLEDLIGFFFFFFTVLVVEFMRVLAIQSPTPSFVFCKRACNSLSSTLRGVIGHFSLRGGFFFHRAALGKSKKFIDSDPTNKRANFERQFIGYVSG